MSEFPLTPLSQVITNLGDTCAEEATNLLRK